MARTLLLALLAAAAAEDCVVDEVDIARIHSTDEDAAADVVAAVLADEAIVVEGIDDAFLTLLSEATNWTHHASIREGVDGFSTITKTGERLGRCEVGLPDGRLPIARHARRCAIANPGQRVRA